MDGFQALCGRRGEQNGRRRRAAHDLSELRTAGRSRCALLHPVRCRAIGADAHCGGCGSHGARAAARSGERRTRRARAVDPVRPIVDRCRAGGGNAHENRDRHGSELRTADPARLRCRAAARPARGGADRLSRRRDDRARRSRALARRAWRCDHCRRAERKRDGRQCGAVRRKSPGVDRSAARTHGADHVRNGVVACVCCRDEPGTRRASAVDRDAGRRERTGGDQGAATARAGEAVTSSKRA